MQKSKSSVTQHFTVHYAGEVEVSSRCTNKIIIQNLFGVDCSVQIGGVGHLRRPKAFGRDPFVDRDLA